MKWFWLFICAGILSACSLRVSEVSSGNDKAAGVVSPVPSQVPKATPSFQEDLGPAPELENETWLNVEGPLRLADMKGKVILLDMWTFGWINCRNVIPSLRESHDRYAQQGLVVIGNHYPEFNYERELANLVDAVQKLGITYAVAQDNDGVTWRSYGSRYWPTLYLIDKAGRIRYVHIGEGRYEETESAIQALLEEWNRVFFDIVS